MKSVIPLLCLVLAAIAVVLALLLRPSNDDIKVLVAAELEANPKLRGPQGPKGDRGEDAAGITAPVGCVMAWPGALPAADDGGGTRGENATEGLKTTSAD